jgi:hypothetical protein
VLVIRRKFVSLSGLDNPSFAKQAEKRSIILFRSNEAGDRILLPYSAVMGREEMATTVRSWIENQSRQESTEGAARRLIR